MKEFWRIFKKNKTAVVGLIIAVIVICVAIFAPLLSPYDPLEQNLPEKLVSPRSGHLMGTDTFGRDTLSRIIYGARVSLIVGISSVIIGMIIGTALGIYAGFKGGKTEYTIMRVTDVLMSFPNLVMGLVIMAILGSGLIKLILAIGIIMAPRFVRIAYGPTLSIKEREFIEATKAIGLSERRIIIKHILPNIFGEVLVMGTLWVGTAIRIEANLSFIGLGVPPPTPTWGNMIRDGVAHLTNAPWLSISPGIAILITILSFNMMGDGIRDITDPRVQQ